MSPVVRSAAVGVVAFAAVAAAEPLPQSAGELIERRGEIGRAVELFSPPSWAGSRTEGGVVTPRPAAAPAPAPAAPPALPFRYGGSGHVNGKAVLFLERDRRSVRAEVGDIVDGTYRIEALERDRAVLRYLPTDVTQLMVFGPADITNAAPAVARQRLQGPILVDVPDEAPLDHEVAVVVGIPPGSAKATVTFNYDHKRVERQWRANCSAGQGGRRNEREGRDAL